MSKHMCDNCGEALYHASFALGNTVVRLVGGPYQYKPGEVWHVEDIRSGHRDFVGVENLKACLSAKEVKP